jgi:fructose-1,6-bisphosphatase/inositol monophosphatase family enzyme
MAADLFERRRENFAQEGGLTSFNLAVVAEGLDIIQKLADENVGGETVEKRLGEYKSWDPEIYRVDKDTEDAYVARLREHGKPVVLLSEEAGRVALHADKGKPEMYVVCDPFDGSYLFKHGIPDFWYSSLAFFDPDFNPLSCAVGDGVHRKIAFANEGGAFIADLKGDRLIHKFQLNGAYRERMGRKPVTDFPDASVESYAMKPKKFMSPLVDEYRDFMELFKFFLPNGGPYGFVDVAEGKIDCYFARQQPYVDIFSGIFVGMQAQTLITDFDGNPVKADENVKTVRDVVATTNPAFHEKVLARIAECKKNMRR